MRLRCLLSGALAGVEAQWVFYPRGKTRVRVDTIIERGYLPSIGTFGVARRHELQSRRVGPEAPSINVNNPPYTTTHHTIVVIEHPIPVKLTRVRGRGIIFQQRLPQLWSCSYLGILDRVAGLW